MGGRSQPRVRCPAGVGQVSGVGVGSGVGEGTGGSAQALLVGWNLIDGWRRKIFPIL